MSRENIPRNIGKGQEGGEDDVGHVIDKGMSYQLSIKSLLMRYQ